PFVGDLASLVVLGALALLTALSLRSVKIVSVLAIAVFLCASVMFLAAGCSRAVRRLHDLGHGGWLLALGFGVDLVSVIWEKWFAPASGPDQSGLRASSAFDIAWCLTLYLLPGQRATNAYGRRPASGISFGKTGAACTSGASEV